MHMPEKSQAVMATNGKFQKNYHTNINKTTNEDMQLYIDVILLTWIIRCNLI